MLIWFIKELAEVLLFRLGVLFVGRLAFFGIFVLIISSLSGMPVQSGFSGFYNVLFYSLGLTHIPLMIWYMRYLDRHQASA